MMRHMLIDGCGICGFTSRLTLLVYYYYFVGIGDFGLGGGGVCGQMSCGVLEDSRSVVPPWGMTLQSEG